MQIRAELAALRGDDSPQRRAQAALMVTMDRWRAEPQPAAVLAELACFEAGLAIADCPALAALFTPGDPAGAQLVSSLVAAMMAELSADPLGHVPMRHSTDGTTSTLLIGQAGLATLTLVAIDAVGLARSPAPVTINYAPGEAWERVLGGSARAEMVTCVVNDGLPTIPAETADAVLEREPLELAPGVCLARDCRREALLLHGVAGRLVTLRLHRRRQGHDPVREYDLASGKLLHRAAASPAESRHELMISLLGRMGRTDAAPLLASMALGGDPDGLRWQALRESIGLDTATGFGALSTLARRREDTLATPAGALRAQLLESWPQLAALEAEMA
jgi:hypothetical protein